MTDLIPQSYVLHVIHVHCKSCGSYARQSDFYELHMIKSRLTGHPVKNLQRCAAPKYHLPCDRIDFGSRTIPFCAACPTMDLSHLPSPPHPSEMRELIGVTLKATPKPSTPTKASVKPNIQDLA